VRFSSPNSTETRADEITGLRVRAAEVELSVGTRTNAVHHLIDAGEFEGAFKIAFSSVPRFVSQRTHRSNGRMDRSIPAGIRGGEFRPLLYVTRSRCAYLGRREEAERWTAHRDRPA